MTPTRVILHCSVTPNGKRVDISEITKWHQARGFKTVGYHMALQPDGEVQRGRSLKEVGAHCEGENHDSIGICLIGTDRFTRAQFKALRYQLESLRVTYSIHDWAVYGHYQFQSAIKQGKTCPNIEINRLLYWYLCNDDAAITPYLVA